MIEKARTMDIDALYLYTENKKEYYLKNNFKIVEKQNITKNDITVMAYTINDVAYHQKKLLSSLL